MFDTSVTQVFVLAQSEMEHNFPLENTDNNDESDSSDNEYSYSNSPLPPTGSKLHLSSTFTLNLCVFTLDFTLTPNR